MIPHKEIRELEDRSWSFRLWNNILESVPTDNLTEVTETLQILSDYRLTPLLTKTLENRQEQSHIRQAAGAILNEYLVPSAHDRQIWWQSGDPILMRHTLANAGKQESEIIMSIAGDTNHPLYTDAIGALAFGFEEPVYQETKTNALNHPNAVVRETACKSLLWDEPICATDGLLKATTDEGNDVAFEALNTLAYYSSQKVLIALHQALNTCTCPIRKEAFQNTIGWIREDFISTLQASKTNGAAAYEYLHKWLEPVWDVLYVTDQDLSDEIPESKPELASDPTPQEKLSPSAAELVNILDEADGHWASKKSLLHAIDWSTFSTIERSTLANYFINHPDPGVRSNTMRALTDWEMYDKVLYLFEDTQFTVHREAVRMLKLLPPQPEIADKLWKLIQNDEAYGAYANDLLDSYAVHASNKDLNEQLTNLALNEQRESVRAGAISILKAHQAKDSLARLLPLLDAPPLVTWFVHLLLIDACRVLNIDIPKLDHLQAIDNLDLQYDLARYLD